MSADGPITLEVAEDADDGATRAPSNGMVIAMPPPLPLLVALLLMLSTPAPATAPVTSQGADDATAAWSPSGKTMQAVPLKGVRCLDGSTAVVYVNQSSTVGNWVIQIGSQSITTSFCISEKTCALFATPPTTPPPPPGPMPISNAGPQSDDCVSKLLPYFPSSIAPTEHRATRGLLAHPVLTALLTPRCIWPSQTINPTFCKFNQAQISDCTNDLLMGGGATASYASTLTNGSAVTMHFDGAALLKASLAKLAELGLGSAKRVLLNGVGWGGTSVILNADAVGAQLRALAPGMVDYRAVAADAIHPKTNHLFWSDKDGPGGNIGGKPYDALTGWLKAHYKLSNPSAALLPGCKAKNADQPWLCLYVNESLPFIKTPLYQLHVISITIRSLD
jgi:hypothetical protein